MKTNTALIVVIVAVLIGGGLLVFSGNKDKAGKTGIVESASTLTTDRELHDFGEIDIFGGKVTTDFLLTNNGPDDIVILAGTTSCGCTDGSIDGIRFGMHEQMSGTVTISAGESKSLTAIYDPLAHGPDATGSVTRQLFLKTNSKVTPEIELRVSANVVKSDNQ